MSYSKAQREEGILPAYWNWFNCLPFSYRSRYVRWFNSVDKRRKWSPLDPVREEVVMAMSQTLEEGLDDV